MSSSAGVSAAALAVTHVGPDQEEQRGGWRQLGHDALAQPRLATSPGVLVLAAEGSGMGRLALSSVGTQSFQGSRGS